jgi:hypothetical protein
MPVITSKIVDSCELANVLSNDEKTLRGILDFVGQFNIKAILKPFGAIKTKGISLSDILILLCFVRLERTSIYCQVRNNFRGLFKGDKNVFYRFQNNGWVDWRKLLFSFALKYQRIIVKKGNNNEHDSIQCFIADDTTLEKTGHKIEFIGKVFDHVIRRIVLGYKMLVLGYWDGKTFTSIDFTIHRELGQNPNKPYGMTSRELKKQFSKKRMPGQPSYVRCKELDKSKLDAIIEMLNRAVKHGFKASYVLVDSWFMCEELILNIRSMRKGMLHVLGMCKIDKRKYMFQNKEVTASEIVTRLAYKKVQYCRKHKMQYVGAAASYKGIPVRMFFVRYGNQDKWHLIITTNMALSFIRAIEIYQIRWTIEVFFKECKQYLNLGRSQCTDFDGQVADCTLALITHTILTLQRRFSAYETMGGLFESLHQEMGELNLWQRLWELFLRLVKELVELLGIDVELAMRTLFIEKDKANRVYILLKELSNENINLKTAA